jgi:periplasmic divalent cation tolerance protein
MAAQVCIALCTAPAGRAEELAAKLVQQRLAACVNVIAGVQSWFWWAGKVDTAAESLLVIKTTRDLVQELQQRLPQWHPYEVPELLVLGVEDGLPAYLRWLVDSCRRPAP